MYLGIFDAKPQYPVSEKHAAPLNSTSIPFTGLYGGLLKHDTARPAVSAVSQRVEWKPVYYKDTVTYVRYAV